MAVNFAVLVPSKSLESATTTQYTATGKTAMIDKFTVTNFSGAAAIFTVWLVASGATAANSNAAIFSRNIAAGETYLCPELVGQLILPGGFIATNVATGTPLLSCRANGREIV